MLCLIVLCRFVVRCCVSCWFCVGLFRVVVCCSVLLCVVLCFASCCFVVVVFCVDLFWFVVCCVVLLCFVWLGLCWYGLSCFGVLVV